MSFKPTQCHKMVYDPKTNKPKFEGDVISQDKNVAGESDIRKSLPAEVVAILRNIDHMTLLKMLPKEKQLELVGSEVKGSPNSEQWLRIRDLSKVELFLSLPQEKREEILMSTTPPQVRVWNAKLD